MEENQGLSRPNCFSIESNSETNAIREVDPRNDEWSRIFPSQMRANWGDTHASGSPDPIELLEAANYKLSQSSLPVWMAPLLTGLAKGIRP